MELFVYNNKLPLRQAGPLNTGQLLCGLGQVKNANRDSEQVRTL